MTAPRVAVLLSTWNGEAFLAEQLDSVAAQEGVDVSVFARDDGSADATLTLLRRYSSRWPALADPARGENLGPAASFLRLLADVPAGFDAYAFCDQDDVWAPDKLVRAVASLSEQPAERPSLYCSRVLLVDEAMRPLGKSPLDGDGRFEHLLFENIAFGNTVVMNAAARNLIGSRAPGRAVIMHDWWCALVISAFGAILYDEQPGVRYRQHRSNSIGAASGQVGEIVRLLRMFMRDPSRFWRVHAQACELLRLFGDDLTPSQQRLTKAMVDSRGSFRSRLAFALGGRMVRRTVLGAIAGRVLVIAGWY